MKGAARVASEFYRPPGYQEDVEAKNLLQEMDGKMWDHSEGRLLLKALLDLGISMHNITNRSKDAIKVFMEMLQMDPADHLVTN